MVESKIILPNKIYGNTLLTHFLAFKKAARKVTTILIKSHESTKISSVVFF